MFVLQCVYFQFITHTDDCLARSACAEEFCHTHPLHCIPRVDSVCTPPSYASVRRCYTTQLIFQVDANYNTFRMLGVSHDEALRIHLL